VFTPEERERYDIESFYGAAEELDLPFLEGPGEGGAGAGGGSGAATGGWTKAL
jgi:hypothetical protein